MNKKNLKLLNKFKQNFYNFKSLTNLKNFQIELQKNINMITKDRYIIINNKAEKYKKILKQFSSKKLNPSLWIQSLQDQIERVASSETNDVFLQQSQVWPRAITWVLMSGTAFAIGWVSIAKTDEVVIAMGKLEPKGGVIDVQMPIEGIAKEVLVKEGEIVEKDQILIKLDTELTEAKYYALNKKLELNIKILDKLSLLVKEGAVSELQYMEQESKIEDIKSEIKASLVRLKYQEIVAPARGIVFELQPKGAGYVARSSQPVMKVVPLDQLLAKIEIDSRSIGFVSEGKKAEISIDSFPASDFGVIEGVVTRIGSDALPPNPREGKGYRFPAQVTLSNQYLKVKSGQKLPLQAGMSLSANIKLRKVTYLQLLLNKFGEKAKSIKSI